MDDDEDYNHTDTSREAYKRRRDEHERHMMHMTKMLEEALSTPQEDMFEALCDQGRILDDIFRAMVLQSCDVNQMNPSELAVALKAQTSFRLAFREARAADKQRQ